MMQFTATIASLLLATQAQPAPVEDADVTTAQADIEATAATEEVTPEPEVNDDDKIICRRTAVTGSKFKKKICGTKKQWETLANRSSDNARDMQRRGKGVEPVR